MYLSDKDIILRLILATVLGGIIGIERESINRPAGFRTHILVCVGSALTMLVSISMGKKFGIGADPGRIAAQVISGIGFLGAGTIIREGASIRGLTTAASLWTVAAIGLAVGSGYYVGAIFATGLVILTLITLSKVENLVFKKKHHFIINIMIKDRPGQLGKIGTALGEMAVNIKNIRMFREEEDLISLELLVRVPANVDFSEVVNKLAEVEGVLDIDA